MNNKLIKYKEVCSNDEIERLKSKIMSAVRKLETLQREYRCLTGKEYHTLS